MVKKVKIQPAKRHWTIEMIGGLVFVVVIIVIGIFISSPKPPPPEETAGSQAITTPLSYTDFIGQVTAVQSDTILVQFTEIGTNGEKIGQIYTISINQTTDLKLITSWSDQATFAPLTLPEIKPNDTVFVAGAEDLATVNSFIATKLYRYPPEN